MITVHCVTSNIQRGVSLDCNTNFTNVVFRVMYLTNYGTQYNKCNSRDTLPDRKTNFPDEMFKAVHIKKERKKEWKKERKKIFANYKYLGSAM